MVAKTPQSVKLQDGVNALAGLRVLELCHHHFGHCIRDLYGAQEEQGSWKGADKKGRKEKGETWLRAKAFVNVEGHSDLRGDHHSSAMSSPAAAAICSSTLSRSSQAAGWMSPYMSSVRIGAALISSERGAGDKLITYEKTNI